METILHKLNLIRVIYVKCKVCQNFTPPVAPFCPEEYQPENKIKTIRNWNMLIQQWNAKQNNNSLP